MIEVGNRVLAIWGAYYPEQEGTVVKIVENLATVEFDEDFDPEAGVPDGVYPVNQIRPFADRVGGSPIGVWKL